MVSSLYYFTTYRSAGGRFSDAMFKAFDLRDTGREKKKFFSYVFVYAYVCKHLSFIYLV